jgi:hypothetical protein
MADFFVFTEPSWVSGHYSLGDNFEEKDLRRGVVLMVNNCAETQAFFRG